MDSKGYQIPLGHIKIGEKIHISDYFYAKRMFQKGYYAYRFAFILSKHLLKEITSRPMVKEANGSTNITLVGYQRYSNLLLSSTERFLKERLHITGNREINVYHEVLPFEGDEEQELEQIKRNGQLYNNRFIIVPISTTLSTQVKVEKFLETYSKKYDASTTLTHVDEKYLPNSKTWMPYFSMILVSPKDMASHAPVHFFWKNIDENEKTVSILRQFPNDNQERTCKYLLNLYTNWQLPEECSYCYPVNPEDELCMFDTDANSQTTPQVIFTDIKLPKSKPGSLPILYSTQTKAEDSAIVVTDQDIQFGNLFYRNTNVNYFLNVDNIINRNYKVFKKWTTKIKSSGSIDFDKSTLLISPVSFFNTSFISLINEYIFNDTASIVRFNPTGDFESNFTRIFEDEIKGADQIFYVDDYITSSNTLNNIQGFINQFLDKNDNSRRILDGAIVFVNQLDEFNMNSLPTKVIDSFMRLNVPTFSTVNDKYYLDILFERNSKVYKDTVNHEVKAHIYKLLAKLKRKTASIEPGVDEKSRFQNLKRIAFQELISDLIGENKSIKLFFSSGEILSNSSLKKFRKTFDKALVEKIRKMPIASICREKGNDVERKIGYLKVLTSSPYVSHERVRKIVCKWILFDLISLSKQLNLKLEKFGDKSSLFLEVEYLKFLIRRGANLSIHFIVRFEFIQFLACKFFPSVKLLIKDYKSDQGYSGGGSNRRIAFLEELELYIISCYKLFLYNNESASLNLEKNILILMDSNEVLKESNFLKILYLENNVFLGKTFKHITERISAPLYYLKELTSNSKSARKRFKENFEILEYTLKSGIERLNDSYNFRIGMKICGLNSEKGSDSYTHLARATLLMIYLQDWNDLEGNYENEGDILKRVQLFLTIIGSILFKDINSTGSLLDLKYKGNPEKDFRVRLDQLFQFNEAENSNLMKKNHLVDLLQYLSINGFKIGSQEMSVFSLTRETNYDQVDGGSKIEKKEIDILENIYLNYYYPETDNKYNNAKNELNELDLNPFLDLNQFPNEDFHRKLFANNKLTDLESIVLFSSTQEMSESKKDHESSRISLATYSSDQDKVDLFSLKLAQWCFEKFHFWFRKTYDKSNLNEHINNLDNLSKAGLENIKNDIISAKITHRTNYLYRTTANGKHKFEGYSLDPILNEISKLVLDSHENFNLVEVANEILESFKVRKDIDLDMTIEGPPNGLFLVNRSRIFYQEIIRNIFSNSIKYAKGYSCHLELEKSENFVILNFVNNGLDFIPENELSLIFDNSYRAEQHSESTVHSGQGKGLYIVKNIVRSLNGSIYVSSKKGRTEFKIITYAG